MDLDKFSNAIALIYDASIDVDRWDDVLAFMCALFGSRKGQISFATSVMDPDVVFRFHGVTETDLKILPRYRELIPYDPRLSTVCFKALHCRQTTSDEVLHASEIYKQALGPADIEYAMWFNIALEENSHCVVSVMRGRQDPPFTERDCTDFSRFVPHVQRAVTIHDTFQRAREEVAAARAAMDAMPLGVLVADEERVVLANRAARALLDEGTALRFDNGTLRTTSYEANAKLANAIQQARSGGDQNPVGVSFPVGSRDHVHAVIRMLHASPAIRLGVEAGTVALYLSDSRKPLETPEEVLQQLFGLTGREAAVLRALVEGDTLREIGQRLGIGLHTVKTHLQHIMQTTGTGRQGQLIKQVLSTPAWIATQKFSKSRADAD
jgi:DNA-binding CsgD family transcriptional regulator/PAS domain-containing protein